MAARLRTACELTLYSDAEFRLATRRLPPEADPVERARRLVVRHAMQVSPDVRPESRGTGFRRHSAQVRRVAAIDWTSYPDAIPAIHERLRGVVVERAPAVQTMLRHDRPEALHYVDPPYVHATRAEARKGYAHELADADHAELLDCVLGLKGMVVLSGYASPLYDEALAGWRRVTREVTDHARQWREEVLWISPSAAAGLNTELMQQPRHPRGRRAVVNPAQVPLF
jgi:DNA adenine methylase